MKSKDHKEAKYLALNNAGAFIESHGEEGGVDQKDYSMPIDMYLKECKNVAKILYAMAEKYKAKHKL